MATTALATRAEVIERLRLIVDPELGLDIVTLGLIYGVAVYDRTIRVTMTLTVRGCPLHDVLAEAIRDALQWLDGAARVELDLVWEPPWHPGMIDRTALV